MINPKLRVINDIFLTISFLVTALSGLALKYAFEKGIRDQSFLMMYKHTWTTMHDYFGIALIVFTLLHFISYWYVIKCTPRILKRKSNN